MKNYTLTDIIKIIPLSEKRRQELLSGIDTYDQNTRYSIEKTCWDIFFDYYQALADLKYKVFFHEAQQGKRKLTQGLMNDAYVEVLKDFENVLSGKKKELDEIDSIRQKLQTIMQQTPPSQPSPSTPATAN